MKIIYIDVLFLVNLIPDYLLLRLTGILWGRYPKRFRLILGSVFAALAAIPLYFVSFGVYGSFIAKAVVCALVCLITFGAKKLGGVCTLFTAMSFAFAGAVSVLCWLGVSDGISVQGATVYANLSVPMLIAATLLAYCVIRLIFGHGDAVQGGKSSDLEITYGSRSIKIRALQDSGNNLCEPYTGKPVIVIGANQCVDLFPKTMQDILTSGEDASDMFKKLASICPSRFSLIPYSTASDNGLMLTFKPDTVLINGRKQDYIIGISGTEINAAGNCRAIIGV